jgi:hypothetical protein
MFSAAQVIGNFTLGGTQISFQTSWSVHRRGSNSLLHLCGHPVDNTLPQSPWWGIKEKALDLHPNHCLESFSLLAFGGGGSSLNNCNNKASFCLPMSPIPTCSQHDFSGVTLKRQIHAGPQVSLTSLLKERSPGNLQEAERVPSGS